MSSSLSAIAYVLRKPEDWRSTAARRDLSRRHLQQLHRSPLEEAAAGDSSSGLVTWTPEDHNVAWPSTVVRDESMVTWLHVPAAAGGPESGVSPEALAARVFSGDLDPAGLGGAAGVLRWSPGRLEIANDLLGLVRLFHYRFPSGDVWSTRQDLAHIFMGERPFRNDDAWAGMATLGWAAGGGTQLGNGAQLPGGSRVSVLMSRHGRDISTDNLFPDWLDTVRSRPAPTIDENLEDMGQLLSTARRWPARAIADLTGGKDSRVGAAVGIVSGSIEAVRTINTDPGEVATASRLMAAIGNPISHLIQEKRPDVDLALDSFDKRLQTKHVAFEGRYLASTAFNTGAFAGFRASPRARLNGLGGEVLAGGNFSSGAWRQRMADAAPGAVGARIKSVARAGLAASDEARERVDVIADAFAESITELGLPSAVAGLDLFYSRDRMPNWSVTFTTDGTLCPLFAPSVLARGAHALGDPIDLEVAHRGFVRQAIPEWDAVPYYKPTFATRSTLPLWARSEWEGVKRFVLERADASQRFESSELTALVANADAGIGGKAEEVAIVRFLWDQTFDSFIDSVTRTSDAVRAAVEQSEARAATGSGEP